MTRYWITTDGVCIRKWIQEEYNTVDPSSHIYEDVLWNVCMNCGKPFSVAHHIITDANGDNPHKQLCRACKSKRDYSFLGPITVRDRNGGYAYLKTELCCMEFGEKEIDGRQCFVTTKY